MDTIIKNLSEIEMRTREVMQEANEEKKRIDAELRGRTQDFDQALAQETERKIEEIRQRLGIQAEAELAAHRQATADTLKQITDSYQEQHEQLARGLFEQMVKG